MASHSRLRVVLLSLTTFFQGSAARASADDAFLAGYATAILEREFSGLKASVRASEGLIYLQARDIQGRDRDKIVAALKRIEGVREVRIEEEPATTPSPGAPPPKPDQSSTGVTGGKW